MPTVHRIDDRPNISLELADRLRDMIAQGELAPGERVNEVRLAGQLGVSRTPLREALAALTAEGALNTVPRRGFFVQKLSRAELDSIYPLRALLDPEALRLAGVPDERRLAQLNELNEKLSRAKQATRRIELDDEWHLLLVESCPNMVLLDLIRQFIRRTRRYELAYLGEGRHLNSAVGMHVEIMNALRKGDLNGACRRLKQNLTSAMEPIRLWLKSRESNGK